MGITGEAVTSPSGVGLSNTLRYANGFKPVCE